MESTNRLILFTVAVACLFCAVESHGHGKKTHRFILFGNSGNSGEKRLQQDIQKNITDVVNDKIPTEVLIQFFTVLNSTEAQKSLKQLQIDPTTVTTLLKKLTGSAQDVLDARQTIKIQAAAVKLDQLKKKDWEAIKQILTVHKNYQCKLQAKKAISEDSTEKLIQGLTALSIVERMFWFRGILFNDLLEALKKNGEQGRKEVVDKLNKWIDSADIQSLKKVSLVYALATGGSKAASTTAPPNGLSTTPQWSSLSTTTSPSGQPSSTSPGGASTTPSGGQSSPAASTTPKRGPE